MSSRVRAVAAATGVAILFLVVAAASSSLPIRDAGVRVALDGGGLAEVLGPAVRLLYLVVMAEAFYLWLKGWGRRGGSRQRRRAVSPAATLFVLLLVAAAIYLFAPLTGDEIAGDPSSSTTPPVSGQSEVVAGGEPVETPAPFFPGSIPWVIVAVLAAVLAVVVFLRRNTAGGAADDLVGDRPEDPGSLDEELETAGDPRGRVFAAYAGVERKAADRGIGRRVDETVAAHLERLPVRSVDEPRSLAEIYDRARFSTHPVTETVAEEAEAAGERLGEDLA